VLIRRIVDPLEVPEGAPTASVPLVEGSEGLTPPFTARVVTVRPGSSTRPHDHAESEIWLVLDGSGEVVEDDRVEPVAPGDAIFLPPLGRHALRNTGADPLLFLTTYWEDAEDFEAELARRASGRRDAATDERPVLLLPSFPTPNGDLHVGHLAGPYVAADVCRRALLLAGASPALLLGTIGHQSQVAVRAERLGVSFYEAAEECTSEIVATLAAAEIEPDVFVRPTAGSAYPEIAADVFRTLRASGAVVPRTREVSYCPACDRYLFEAFVVGTCPHCGARDATGTECERCALHHDDSELREPRCTTCGRRAERRPLERFYLPLEPLRPLLEGFAEGAAMNPRLRAFVRGVLDEELPEIAVSYVSDAGIPLGVPGFERQRLYSSFELAARFLAAVDELAGGRGWRDFVRAERPRTVLFFGHDNAYLRAIIFPAVLGAYSGDVPLPDALVMNEFYLLDGSKFSTGRDHAVWGRELVETASPDAVRLYLALTAPEGEQTNFTLEDFADTVESELVGEWQRWLHELAERVASFGDGTAPEAGPWSDEAKRFYAEVGRVSASVRAAYDPRSFSTREAARELLGLVRSARRFGTATGHFVGVDSLADHARTSLALELLAARALALLAAPIVPDFSDRLLRALGDSTPPDGHRFEEPPAWVRPGTDVGGLADRWFEPTSVGAEAAVVR
jgi:methionyl-tRNA synthetase